MATIRIDKGLSTGLIAEFDQVGTVDIEDKQLAEGGFGAVYRVLAINGHQTGAAYVVKLFKDNGKGSALQNYETTQRLQRKAAVENDDLLAQQGKTLVELYPAFKGLPQFSFEGQYLGKNVTGFCALNLVTLGFTDFEDYLTDPTRLGIFQQFPIDGKMLLGYQFASAFKVLEKFQFIHADLKPGALFVNLKTTEIAIIDYDSGAIITQADDEPLTWGAPNDWVAPEIWEQQAHASNGGMIRVDRYSDRWSIAIGIHYLMTGYHPLFYLTELSPRIAKQYFKPPNAWPQVNKQAPYFQKLNEALYDQYLPWVTTIVPQAVRDKIAHALNYGYNRPVARPSYSDWVTALQSIQQAPVIDEFSCDKQILIKGIPCELKWQVSHAYEVTILPGVGKVASSGQLTVTPATNVRYTLTAKGFYGMEQKQLDLVIFPIPVLETLMVPAPNFSSTIQLSNLSLHSPSFDLAPRIPLTAPSFQPGPVNFDLQKHFPAPRAKWKFNFSNLYAYLTKYSRRKP